jgi:hypothetical protein
VRTGGIEPPWQRLEGARSANDPSPLRRVLAESCEHDSHALPHRALSRRRPRPGGLTLQIGALGRIRTRVNPFRRRAPLHSSHESELVRVRCSAHRPPASKAGTLLARASPCELARTRGVEPLPSRSVIWRIVQFCYVRVVGPAGIDPASRL